MIKGLFGKNAAKPLSMPLKELSSKIEKGKLAKAEATGFESLLRRCDEEAGYVEGRARQTS